LDTFTDETDCISVRYVGLIWNRLVNKLLKSENVNHVGIRVSDKVRSVAFYELLGFEFKSDVGFEDGHPIIMGVLTS